jgi:hypothetical protein
VKKPVPVESIALGTTEFPFLDEARSLRPSVSELGSSGSFAAPSVIIWSASHGEATFSLPKIRLSAAEISGRRFSMAFGSYFNTLNS